MNPYNCVGSPKELANAVKVEPRRTNQSHIEFHIRMGFHAQASSCQATWFMQ